jgi:hypothetical protein
MQSRNRDRGQRCSGCYGLLVERVGELNFSEVKEERCALFLVEAERQCSKQYLVVVVGLFIFTRIFVVVGLLC